MIMSCGFTGRLHRVSGFPLSRCRRSLTGGEGLVRWWCGTATDALWPQSLKKSSFSIPRQRSTHRPLRGPASRFGARVTAPRRSPPGADRHVPLRFGPAGPERSASAATIGRGRIGLSPRYATAHDDRARSAGWPASLSRTAARLPRCKDDEQAVRLVPFSCALRRGSHSYSAMMFQGPGFGPAPYCRSTPARSTPLPPRIRT